MLLFPRASSLKDIYWDPAMNLKSELYGTGALGPPALFSTRDGKAHQQLRKALGGNQVAISTSRRRERPRGTDISQWSIGFLKNTWESLIDDQISLFQEKMAELAQEKREIILSDKVA